MNTSLFYCSTHDRVEFGFWLGRYVFTAVLFLIGLKGPGMPTNPYAALRDEDEEGKVTHSRDFLPISWGRISAPFPIENSHLFSQYHVRFSQIKEK